MSENLALDFFRLLIIKVTKEDKLEAYHRVLDLAFKIMSPVHQKMGAKLRTHQNQDAMILYQMAISKGLAIMGLIDGVEYKNRETGASRKFLDPSPIAALTRTQFEAFSTFHNIYNSNEDSNVINLLYDIWVIAGLKERLKGSEPKLQEHKTKAQNDKNTIDKLILRVKNNQIFKDESIEKQKKILDWIDNRKFEVTYRNKKLVLLNQKDMFINAGVNQNFENQYAILSWYIHPSNISVTQFGQMFEKNFNEEHAFTLLNISRIILSMLVVEYCNYFPLAKEEFQNLSKLDQLIVYVDNKTFRFENNFSTDAWKTLDNELTTILNTYYKK
jgi:hypothetical protein